jgi:hypothetical protein
MSSKFSTLASSLFLALGLLLTEDGARAQAATPAPKTGYIRFWDMLPPANGSFEIRKVGGGADAGMMNGSGYKYGNYMEFPPGGYHLGLYKKGDTTAPLKIFDINLRPDTYFTILLSPQNGVMTAELLDDTIDPKTTAGTLTIRNYFTGTTVSVSSDTQKIIDALPYGQSYSATGFPLQRLQLTLKTKLPNGSIAESGAEADLHASPHSTLLIIPDSYGRFRPRTTIDGKDQ